MNRLHRTVAWTITFFVSLCTAGTAVAAEGVPPATSAFADSLPYIIGGAITLCILAVGFVLHLGKRTAESRPSADAAPFAPPSQGSPDSTEANSLDPQPDVVPAPNLLPRLIVPGIALGGIGV